MASLCKNLRLSASPLLSASNRPLQTLLRAFHNIAPPSSSPPADFPGEAMERRKASPAHFLLKIDSFSSFFNRGIDKFETKAFEAGGYNWKLIIYPNGDQKDKYGENVAVKLALADTSALPANWEIDTVFSLCLFNYESQYYNYALGRTSFNAKKKELGFHNFISKKYLTDRSSGYLKNDRCVFGAEVFVHENKAVTEYLSLEDAKVPLKKVITISNFASVKDVWNSHKTWTSDEFTAGGHTWKLSIYRNGYGESSLKTFLHHVASENSCETPKATYSILFNKNQSPTNEWETISSSEGSFIDLSYVMDKYWGDCVRLQVKIIVEDS